MLQERRGEHDLHCVQVSVGHRNGNEHFPRLPDAAAKAISRDLFFPRLVGRKHTAEEDYW